MFRQKVVLFVKTIAVCSNKGGAGKSSVTISLGVQAVLEGREAAIFDLDPQGTATAWFKNRVRFQDSRNPPVLSITLKTLDDDLRTARQHGAELVIIDTPPSSDAVVEAATQAADFVLIPCRPNFADLDAIRFTLKLVIKHKKPAAVILNSMPPQGYFYRMEAEESVKDKQVQLCPHTFGDRASFRRPLGAGLSAQEYEQEGKAAREIKKVYKWVCQQIGL